MSFTENFLSKNLALSAAFQPPSKVGYKVLRSKVKEGIPHLESTGGQHEWVPGENISTLEPGKHRGGAGFYSIDDLEALAGNYYPGYGNVPAQIASYGLVLKGETGLRGQKAEIMRLYGGGELCDFCGQEKASIVVFPPLARGEPIYSCMNCRRRIVDIFPRADLGEGLSTDELLARLSDRYQVDVQELPEKFVQARRPRYGNR